MPDNFIPTSADYLRTLPEIILTLAGTLLMILEGLAGERSRKGTGPLALLAIVGAFAAAFFAGLNNRGPAFQNFLIIDDFATYFRLLVLIVGAFTVLCSLSYVIRENIDSGEYYALILFSLVGQCLLATSNELIMVFIGLEISSIATYILAGYNRDDRRNNEAAIKYFLLGSFATAFLLYGVAWIYGLTGTTNLAQIGKLLADPRAVDAPWMVGACCALMFVGFAFKVSAAPFQSWTPDVYQGAPAPITMFMSAGPKAAAFAVFLRVFTTGFSSLGESWEPVVWISALLTMIIGNFAALTQSNVKRVLAYSSIAHAGYVLVAIAARSEIGTAAALFYLGSYAFMNLGAFAIVTHFSRTHERYVLVEDLAGLSQKQPVIAALFTVFLLSLIGVPLTSGFFGKFYVFKAAIDSKLFWLAVLGLLNSAVAAYYYLRMIVVMYFHEPGQSVETSTPPAGGVNITIWASAIMIVVLGVYPSLLLKFATLSSYLQK
jgi:NADH-quinone oxidoreductase subunit N